jgi:hypothetical protein
MNVERLAVESLPSNCNEMKYIPKDVLTILFISVWGLTTGSFVHNLFNISYNSFLPICLTATLITLNYCVLRSLGLDLQKVQENKKTVKIAFLIFGIALGIILKISINADISIIALNIFSTLAFLYTNNDKQIFENLKGITKKIAQECYGPLKPFLEKLKLFFEYKEPLEVTEAREQSCLSTIRDIEELKMSNSESFRKLEELKFFIQNEKELNSSFSKAVNNSYFLFENTYYMELPSLNSKLIEEYRWECLRAHDFNIMKRKFSSLLDYNPEFKHLFQLKLMQNSQMNTIEWINSH